MNTLTKVCRLETASASTGGKATAPMARFFGPLGPVPVRLTAPGRRCPWSALPSASRGLSLGPGRAPAAPPGHELSGERAIPVWRRRQAEMLDQLALEKRGQLVLLPAGPQALVEPGDQAVVLVLRHLRVVVAKGTDWIPVAQQDPQLGARGVEVDALRPPRHGTASQAWLKK